MAKRDEGEFLPSKKTKVRRLSERASYSKDDIFSVLDEAFICHVGFNSVNYPIVLPMAFGRCGHTIYLHGAAANDMLKTIVGGSNGSVEVCVEVTLVDGVVLSKSMMHHSINYRSVVLIGKATLVRDREEKLRGLEAIVNHLLKGRSQDARWPSEIELKKTIVVAVEIVEASMKKRDGGPNEDDSDLDLNVWSGVLPVSNGFKDPLPDKFSFSPVPSYVENLTTSKT